MYRILGTTLALVLMAGQPAYAQQHDHGEEAGESQRDTLDTSAPGGILEAYRNALIQRDAAAMTALFVEESLVVENGKVEGTFTNYMEHHLGPELHAIKSFEFFDVTTEIELLGKHVALGSETYRYRIELTDGRVFERKGVATSVLTHGTNGEWAILRYHSSSRAQ